MSRTCGQCSLCCKVMAVPEVKERHSWCPHARPGKGGCAIYKDRPELCRTFSCQWLIDAGIAEHWYPAKARIVISSRETDGRAYLGFVVDPAYPNRWREEPYFSDIRRLAREGMRGDPRIKSEGWTTVVLIKDQTIPISP